MPRSTQRRKKKERVISRNTRSNVAAEKAKDGNEGILSFLFSGGFSPYAHPTANISTDGSFCSGRLGPGKYFLYFTRHSEEGPTLAAYYPGVRDREKASIIEINAGQTQSGITFKVPDQQRYSVRGFLSIYDSSRTGPHSAYIELVNLDAVPFPVGQRQRIDFESSSAFPKIKYFDFERVLPGRYTAYISGLGRAWYTKKEEVNVTNHMKFISLELARQK
jgi:hypothetical protein